MSQYHLVIVEDDFNTLDMISRYFEKENMTVKAFSTVDGVESYVTLHQVDLCILDVMIGNDNGFDLLKSLKAKVDVPIIFVTAKSDEFDRIYGIEIGADDYLTKPFSPKELVARAKRLLSRVQNKPPTSEVPKMLQGGSLSINLETMEVTDGGLAISLTLKEYETLVFLLENPKRVLSRDHIIESVWGYDALGQTRMVDDIIKRLRKKVSISIETVWGIGYKYNA